MATHDSRTPHNLIHTEDGSDEDCLSKLSKQGAAKATVGFDDGNPGGRRHKIRQTPYCASAPHCSIRKGCIVWACGHIDHMSRQGIESTAVLG